MNHEDTKTRSLRLAPAFDAHTEELGREIVDSAYVVHKALGPGLLESAYEACLRQELLSRRLAVAVQVPIGIEYRGLALDCGFSVSVYGAAS